MNRRTLITIILIAVLVIIGILAVKKYTPKQTQDKTNTTQLANPAAVYCINNEGKYLIKKDQNGNEVGVCSFTNGKECDAWQFYKHKCTP